VGQNIKGKESDIPNFMIRHGGWKLIIPKRPNADTLDMLYNLQDDPYEEVSVSFFLKECGFFCHLITSPS